MTIPAGTRVRRYEVQHLLGAGGMGDVYLARDVELDRTVALKVLPAASAGQSADDDRVRRFLQEARAAISLNHPNVAHIYDAGDEGGVRFIAMEYVEGETLRARLHRERLPIEAAYEIITQVASALGGAHAAGIVHRDIKPENVMLRPDGYVKVLDFGLAKLNVSTVAADDPTRVFHTAAGVVLGTMHYMSPEQLRGEDVDARSDVFSLGVLLYEMVSGKRPFDSSTPSGIIAAILTAEPPPLGDLPPELRAIIERALSKNRDERYANARELEQALKRAQHETARIRSGDVPTQALTRPVAMPGRSRRLAMVAALTIVVLALGVLGIWWAQRARAQADARAALPAIEQLIDQNRYFEAWDRARKAEQVLGSDAQLVRLFGKMTEELNVTTEPGGARVYLQRVRTNGEVGPRELAGTTPLRKHAIARGDYVMSVEKETYAPAWRPLNTQPLRHVSLLVPQPARPFDIELRKASEVPEGMAFVEGGSYELAGWMFLSDSVVQLAPFFIDRYEVSNRQYEQFIRAGGYRHREWWKHPFVKDGRTLSFEEAMSLFRDTTGVNGPRGWTQGTCPAGRENYPVTGVSWYEASAFAEYAGKKLPTVYEWDKAARNGRHGTIGSWYPWGEMPAGSDVTMRANYRGVGPMPVDSLPAGMSGWGVQHMAGNVSELLRNRNGDGFAAAGGAFDDPVYQFSQISAFPGFHSGPKLGFRCVREAPTAGDQGGFDLSTEPVAAPVFTPVNDAVYETLRHAYDYEKTPLDVKAVGRVETNDWVREKVTYRGSRGKTVIAYLYLPKGTKPPYQVVHVIPAGDVASGMRSLTMSAEATLPALIRGGRAVFGIVLEGYLERPLEAGTTRESATANTLVDHVIDVRRGLDYLASRPDIDAGRIGLYGPSAGAVVGLIVTAVDERYRTTVFSGTGIRVPDRKSAPQLDRVNFIPHIRGPKLMIHGKYDEDHPLKTEGEPVFRLMRGEKKMVLFEGGHVPTVDWLVPQLITWYDQTLGPVRQ